MQISDDHWWVWWSISFCIVLFQYTTEDIKYLMNTRNQWTNYNRVNCFGYAFMNCVASMWEYRAWLVIYSWLLWRISCWCSWTVFVVTAGFATCQVHYVRVGYMCTTYMLNFLLTSSYHSIILLPRSFRTNILF